MAQSTCFGNFLSKFIGDLINTGVFNPTPEDIENLQTGVSQFLTAFADNAPEKSQSDILKGAFDCTRDVANTTLENFDSLVNDAIVVIMVMTIVICIVVILVLISDEPPPLKLTYAAILSLTLILATLAIVGSINISIANEGKCEDSLKRNEEVYLFQATQSVNSAVCAYSH